MRMRIAVPEAHVSPDVVDAALESVTRLDQQLIQSGKVPPFNMQGPGVVWRPEPPGDEHFDHAATVLGRGWGDCDDLAPWHAASLRTSGEDPGASAVVVPSGPNTYHAVVQRSDGSLDDPSAAAGMPTHEGGSKTTVVGGYVVGVYGSLLPTCGPLSTSCGPAYAVRHLGGGWWQGRADAPVVGSHLVRVHSYLRRRPHHRAHRVHRVHGAACGMVPYCFACEHTAADPHLALQGAVLGAAMYAHPEDAERLHAFLASAR